MHRFDVRFERCNSIVGKAIGGDVFLLDDRGKQLHTLNRMGMFIWGLLEDVPTLSDIVRKVSDKFHLPEEVAHAGAREFLAELVQKGAVRVLDGDGRNVI